MKKGTIFILGIVIACVIAFLFYQFKGKPTNTATKTDAVDTPKPMENVEKLETPIKPNIETDHVWRFPFKEAIDKKTIDNKVYILNEEKQKLPVSVEVNDKEILVRPPQEGYGKDKTYELFVEKEIKQVDGKNIDPIHFTFITKRDEVANVKYSEDIIKIKHSEVKDVNGDVIVLKSNKLEDKLKKDSLIVIETNNSSNPEVARKVVSVKVKNKVLEIDTTTPEFEELFEELDLYKEIPITSENIKLESIKGLTLTNRSTAFTANASNQYLAEGKGSNSTLHFDNVKWDINGTEIALNGTLDLNNLKGTPDTVIKKKSIKKFNMYYEQKAEARLSLSVKGEKQKVQLEDKRRLKIGDVGPINLITGVSLNGELYLVVSTSASGEPTFTLTLTAENQSGVNRKDKKFKVFSDTNFSNSSLEVHGEGQIDNKVVLESSVYLKAFEILSVGVGGEIGGYSNATVFTNKQEAFTCGKGELGGGWSGEIFVKAFPKFSNIWNRETHYKYTLRTKFIEDKINLLEVNTCKEARGLIPSETPLKIEPGEESDIGLQLVEYDHGTGDERKLNLGSNKWEKLSVKSKDENVAAAEVTKDGAIRVKAGTMPAKTNTEIEVTYTDEELKGNKTVTIPVQIKNYDPNITKGLEGMWRIEAGEPYFYKIITKGQNKFEITAMRLLENDYTAVLDITKSQKNVVSGKPEYTFVYPGIIFEPSSEISIEKLSKDKIKITDGNVTHTLVKTTDDARDKEIMNRGNTKTNQPNDNKPEGTQKPNTESPKRMRTVYDTDDPKSKVQVYMEFEPTNNKKALVRVEQRLNNEDGSLPSLTGLFETEATQQSGNKWTFSWQDDTGTKGTGTITINGDQAIIDIKSERNSSSEGKGIMTYKSQLPKIHQFEKTN
ncbi:hypothetical protein [Bacillus bombysepticus]|uniref:hypothetical protein n=1 Tax=Bacillus bombysepticus TaxID=658666 RepID=UPI003018DF9E